MPSDPQNPVTPEAQPVQPQSAPVAQPVAQPAAAPQGTQAATPAPTSAPVQTPVAQAPQPQTPPPSTPPPPPPQPQRPPMPPPYTVPPPPPPPRAAKPAGRGCGFWLLAMFALLFFCTTVLLLISFVALFSGEDGIRSSSGERRHNLTETTLEGSGSSKILLLPLEGVIGDVGGMFGEPEDHVGLVQESLKQARDDAQVKAVLLYVDSPGGGLTASDVLYHNLVSFQKETQRPVVTLFGDVAASGGYYVAAATQEIIAHPTTLTGSIGVIMPMIGIEKLLEKIGVESRTIKAGELKDMGSMTRPMNERERAMLQSIANEYHQQFIQVVLKGMKNRGVTVPPDAAREYCDGRVFSAEEAKKMGFVDKIGYYDEAIASVRQKAGLNPADTRVVTYHRKLRLLEMLLANSQAPKRQTKITVRVQGLPDLAQSRFFYMWMPGVSGVSSTAQ